MEKKILKNGLTVLYEERDSETAVIQVLVKSGSNHETKETLGVAHFVEHRVFETKTRKQREITSKIENLGGEINAFTGKENTNFYIYIPKKHFDKGFDIMSDMMQNASFDEKEFEKEKKIILEEVKLWKDDPKLYQWVLFESALFKGSPAGEPTIGTIKTIKNMKRDDLVNFYEKNYTPENMIICILGKIDNVFEKVGKAFENFNRKTDKKENTPIEIKNKKTNFVEKRRIDHSYMVLGYKVPLRKSKESYALDVIANILGYGLSSRLFEEIRNKRSLAYQVGVDIDMNKEISFFSVFLSTDKSNIEECKRIILNEFEKLKNLDDKDLKKAKTSIEGSFLLKKENPVKLALSYSFWEYIDKAELLNEYIEKIKKVTIEDVKNVVEKYFDNEYTDIVIEQE